MAVDWTKFATGGARRPDSFSGMNPDFSAALGSMFAAAPPEIQQQLRVSSGYRSPQRQSELWQQALKKYGSPEAARKWVAPPGNSQHNHGHAADLKYLGADARKWAHENASQYGLSFPLSNENWHIELASARGGKPKTPISSQIASAPSAPPQASGTPAPVLASSNVGSAPIMGSMSAPQPQQSVPEAVIASAQPQSTATDKMGSMFAAMMAQEQQRPQFQPVQFQGPSGDQAQALTSFIQALRQRMQA